MVDQKDLYRTAQLLIRLHGENARNEAVQKYKHFLESGDVRASSLWLHISSAIEDLDMVSSSGFKH